MSNFLPVCGEVRGGGIRTLQGGSLSNQENRALAFVAEHPCSAQSLGCVV